MTTFLKWFTLRRETESEMMERIDKMLEPEVNAEIARMDKNFACHGSIYDCSPYQHKNKTL